MAWYRVRIEAQHKSTGQLQSCDRRLVADSQQGATALGLSLLGIDATDWQICQSVATPQGEQLVVKPN